MKLEDKVILLTNELKKYKKIVIAYSGGVDSSLLVNVAVEALGNKNVIAVTATSLSYTDEELKTAKGITNKLKIKHIIMKTNEFKNEEFIKNSKLRCYYCKKELFQKLNEVKDKYKCDVIMDGANFDDKNDYRPGTKAEKEFNIITPLKDTFFTKEDVRVYSKMLGLKTYNYPSLACLASRIPYDEEISESKIKMIKAGEEFLRQFGFKNLRLRTSEYTVRIEVDKLDFDKIILNKEKIIKKLKTLGYKYITLDLEGFRSGSMNEVIK